MKKNLFVIITVILFVLIFGFMIYLSVRYGDCLDLLSWSIFDIVELFVVMFIGTVAAYYLSVIYPRQEKRKELELAHIGVIMDDLAYLIKFIEQKQNNNITNLDKRDILLIFRMVFNDFQSYLSLPNKKKEQKLLEIKNMIFDLKGTITDIPFTNQKITYDDYSEAFKRYLILKSQIVFYKNSLFF